MSVTDGSVSFNAQSSSHSAASFSERLGLNPTFSREIGDPVGNKSSDRRMTKSQWTLQIDYDAADGKRLDDALLELLARFDDHLDELDGLRPHFDCWVQFHGSSDSGQGGFWLSPATLGKLGRLGVELLGTVYLTS